MFLEQMGKIDWDSKNEIHTCLLEKKIIVQTKKFHVLEINKDDRNAVSNVAASTPISPVGRKR